MAKNDVNSWDVNPDNNTDVGGNNIGENCPPSTINNAIRSVMAQVKVFFTNTPKLDGANTFLGQNAFNKLISAVPSDSPNDSRGLRFIVDGVEYLQAYYDNIRTILYSGGVGFRFDSPIELLGQPMTLSSGGSQVEALRGVKFKIDGVQVGQMFPENTGMRVDYTSNLRFVSNATERFRATNTNFNYGAVQDKDAVTDGGDCVSISYGGTVWANRTSAPSAIFKRSGTDGTVIQFAKSVTAVGSISVSGSGTSFNTSSDERLKQDFKPISPALIDRVKVYDYAWRSGEGRGYGVKAQELASIVPQAVSRGDKETDMWGVDYSRLVPILIASIQDLRKRLDAVEGK